MNEILLQALNNLIFTSMGFGLGFITRDVLEKWRQIRKCPKFKR